jgi:peroxiredoxin Q/BCP
MKLCIFTAIVCLMLSIFSSANEGEAVKPYAAPQSEARDQDGKTVKLADFYKNGLTLVYFYPMAGTPGCTKQACSLRDSYEELTKRGVQVVGVSRDKESSQKKFSVKNHLPFTLLSDPEGKVLKDFGVGSFLGFASRQAFLVKDGMIIWRDKHASTEEQAADILRVLDAMNKK